MTNVLPRPPPPVAHYGNTLLRNGQGEVHSSRPACTWGSSSLFYRSSKLWRRRASDPFLQKMGMLAVLPWQPDAAPSHWLRCILTEHLMAGVSPNLVTLRATTITSSLHRRGHRSMGIGGTTGACGAGFPLGALRQSLCSHWSSFCSFSTSSPWEKYEH